MCVAGVMLVILPVWVSMSRNQRLTLEYLPRYYYYRHHHHHHYYYTSYSLNLQLTLLTILLASEFQGSIYLCPQVLLYRPMPSYLDIIYIQLQSGLTSSHLYTHSSHFTH